MIVDSKIVNEMINESDDIHYIGNLYDIYILISRLVQNDFDNNKSLLIDLENKIYTISNKVLSEEEKIKLELNRIKSVNISNNNLVMKTVIDKNIQYILDLMKDAFSNDFIDNNPFYEIIDDQNINNENEKIFSIKKKIAILEAELDIPINFFDAAYTAFMNIYKKYYKSYKKENGEKYECI